MNTIKYKLIIPYRYFNKKKRYAMLDTLFAAETTNNQIDYQGIREEVDTFMFEGYDTTSAALMLNLLMLAHHAEEQNKVFAELVTLLGNQNIEIKLLCLI